MEIVAFDMPSVDEWGRGSDSESRFRRFAAHFRRYLRHIEPQMEPASSHGFVAFEWPSVKCIIDCNLSRFKENRVAVEGRSDQKMNSREDEL